MGGHLGALLVILAIALGAASVEADIDVSVSFIEMALDAYPAAPPSTFTGAVVELTNTNTAEDIYIVPGTCTLATQAEDCDIREIFEYCCPLDVCNGNAPVPTGMETCVCASRADRVCVDPFTPYTFAGDAYLTTPPWFDAYPFEIPLKPRNTSKICTNHIIMDTGSLIGDHDLYLVSMTQSIVADFSAAETGAFSYGKDSFALCAGLNEDDSNCIARWYTNRVVGEVAPRITGLLIGYGRFNLTVSLSNKMGLVRYADAVHHKLASPRIECGSEPIYVSSISPPYLPVMLPPTDEPALDILHGVSCYKDIYENATPYGNKIALLVGIAEDSVTILTPNIANLSFCTLHVNLYNENGGLIWSEDNVTYLNRTNSPSKCNPAQLNMLRDALAPPNCTETNYASLRCKLELEETNIALKSISRVATDTFMYAEFELDANASLPMTKECMEAPGSLLYANNSCCNVDLTWTDCCHASPQAPVTWHSNESLVSDQCYDSQCASNLASALASFEAIPQQCRQEALNATFEVFDPFANGRSARSLGPCYELSISGSDAAFLECANQYLDDAYKAEFIALWRTQNDSISINISDWLDTAWSVYYERQGCYQPGYPPFDVSYPTMRNLSLDNDPALCTQTNSCNWGSPDLTFNQCVDSYRPLGMCASCSDGYCTDYTVATACYIPWAGQSQCNSTNGTADPELICLLSNMTDAASCLPATYCDVSQPECLPFCYLSEVLIAADCNCSTCEWYAAKSFCLRNDTRGQLDCEAKNGTYWLGRVWQAPVRANESSCLGYCDDYLSALTQAECDSVLRPAGWCSNFGYYDNASCIANMGCNDSVLDNGGIPACLRDYSLYGSTYTGCGGQADKMPSAGCVWLDGDRAGFTAAEICYYYGGQLLMPANDSDTCLSIGRCQEPDFAPGVTTPKSEADCNACGGKWLRAFDWAQGVWTPAPNVSHWHPLQWVNRTYAPRFSVTSFLNREKFLMDFYLVLAGQQARAVETAIACKGAGLFDLVSAMACRCAENSNGQCASIAAYYVLGRMRACLSTPTTFSFAEGENVTMENAVYSPLCADLSVEQVDRDLLKRRNLVESSSILLQVFAADEYTVVPNAHDVLVASLVGNGRHIVLDGATIKNGTYYLCTSVNETSATQNHFPNPAFATYEVSTKKWTLLQDVVDAHTTNVYCGRVQMVSSVIVFPVLCANNPDSQVFRDQLGSVSVKRTLLACIIIYLVISMIVLARFLLAVRAAIEDPKQKVDPTLFCVLFGSVFCALTIRWVYDLVFYIGRVIHTTPGPLLLLVDLPFFIYSTTFTILISRWATAYEKTKLNKGIKKAAISVAAISVNVLLYGLFLGVLFAFGRVSVPGNNGESYCTTSYNSRHARQLRVLGKAYRTIEAIVSILLAVGFLVYSSIFYYPFLRGGNSAGSIFKLSAIAALCAVSLLLQATLFLFVTFNSTTNGTAVLICLLLVEIIPVLALLFLWGNKALLPCICSLPPEEPTTYCTPSMDNEGPPLPQGALQLR